jgi:hypothetical protein
MKGPDGRASPADVSWSPFSPRRRKFIAMRIIRVSTSGFAAALLIVAFGSSPSEAGLVTTVTPTVTPQVGGTFLYSYQVANDSISTVGVAEFDLAVSVQSNLTSLSAPMGFLSLYTTGDAFVQFLSTDSSFDIAPGSSGSFSFNSPLGPVLEPDLTAGFDSTSGTRFQNPGSTLAPAAAPEPSTLVLFAMGSIVLGAVTVRRRRKSSRS